jgi:hypothetical protein
MAARVRPGVFGALPSCAGSSAGLTGATGAAGAAAAATTATGALWPTGCASKCSRSIVAPSHKSTARSITLRSSRMLPGQR